MFRKKKKSSYSYTPTTEKKKWTKKKKLGCGCLSIILILFLMGACSLILGTDTNEIPATPDQSTEEKAEEKEQDNSNLKIGEAAKFNDYSIKINSIQQVNGYVLTSVTIHTDKDMTFEVNDFEGVSDSADRTINPDPQNDKKLKAGEDYTTDIQFANFDLNKIEWDYGFDEATWSFKADPNNNFDKVEEEKKQAEEAQKKQQEEAERQKKESEPDEAAALTAIEEYGKEQYPYGFKLHTLTDMRQFELEEDGSYMFVIGCTITNAFDAERDAVCRGFVKGVGTNPNNYVVEQFYED